MNQKISVIVPVHNRINYVRDCIASILNQSYSNFELLIVDDGSDNDCANELDEYKEKNCSVYHIARGGVSKVRNYGIAKAIGEYVCFVDSDDLLEPHYLEYLLKACLENKTKIAACFYLRFSDIVPSGKVYGKSIIIKQQEKWKNILENNSSAEGFLWNKMFARDIVSGIRFDETLSMSEDMLFTFQCCDKVDKISIVTDRLYFYRKNVSSTTSNLKESQYEQAIVVAEKIRDIVGKDNLKLANEGYTEYLCGVKFNYCNWLIKNLTKNNLLKIKNIHKDLCKYYFEKDREIPNNMALFLRHRYIWISYNVVKILVRRILRREGSRKEV